MKSPVLGSTPLSPGGAAFLEREPFDSGARTADGDVPFGSQPVEISRARGLVEVSLPRTWLLPPRSLAVGASPQPDRLGHLLSRLVTKRRLGETLRRGASPFEDAFARARPARTASGPRLLGPLSALLREEERVLLARGAFHRRTAPAGAPPRSPQAVPSLWKEPADAFFDPRILPAF